MNLRIISLLIVLLVGVTAQAEDGLFLLPNVAVGFNSVQGTFYRLGLDLGYRLDNNYYFGVGGYYAMGDHPDDDREIGGGPFVGVIAPVTDWLNFQMREDIDYVDERNPILLTANPDTYTYDALSGMISATYAGVQIWFTRNFGVSAGYRLEIGLTKSSLADGRSGTVLGVTIGI